MNRITGNSRPATHEEVNREADRIVRELRSTRFAQPDIEVSVGTNSPGAVASELRIRGFDVKQLDGNRVRVAKQGGGRTPFFG